jgi:hypothetical protein
MGPRTVALPRDYIGSTKSIAGRAAPGRIAELVELGSSGNGIEREGIELTNRSHPAVTLSQTRARQYKSVADTWAPLAVNAARKRGIGVTADQGPPSVSAGRGEEWVARMLSPDGPNEVSEAQVCSLPFSFMFYFLFFFYL